MMLNFKRQLVVLMLDILLSNKKPRNGAHAKNGISNKKLEFINWVINWNFLIHKGAWKI